jgi:RNA polymerase sigma factor (sigma-70 family)
MPGRRSGASYGDLGTLFRLGVVGDWPDGRLLDHFVDRRDAGGEAAFEALVRRHGPMVWRICRGVLGDQHAAEDAFQATFLVLAERASSIRRRDSAASWLYGVARRISRRARADAARRRLLERRAARPSAEAPGPEGPDDHEAMLREVDRLPAHYRGPILLHDLGGVSYEEAARRLGCPVGTVKTRLHRGRALLRSRLTARGLSPALDRTPAAVPVILAWRTVRSATAMAMGRAATAAVPPAVAATTNWMLGTMLMNRIISTAAVLLVTLGLLAGGAVAVVASGGLGPGGPVGPEATPVASVLSATPARKEGSPTEDLFRKAIRGVEVYRNLQERAFYFSRIASAQARHGDREAARQTFARAVEAGAEVRMDESMHLPHVLATIAKDQVAFDFRDEARRTLREALRVAEQPPRENNASQTVELLTRVMGLQQKLGDDEDARETYERALRFVEASDDRFLTAFRDDSRARLQADHGDFDAAIATIIGSDSDPDVGARGQVVQAIAYRVGTRQPPDGRAILGRLRALAEAIDEPSTRAQALQWIAEALAKIGAVDEALEVARSIVPRIKAEGLGSTIAFNTARVLAVVAAAQARAGGEEEARSTFAEAVEVALGIEEDDSRRGALGHVVNQQVEAGHDEGALQTIALIGDDSPDRLISTLESIALRLRKSGDEEAARDRLREALGLAEEQLEAAPPAEDAEQGYRQRNRIHARIARLHGELGEVDPAIEAARRTNEAGAESDALKEVARVVALSGDLRGALRAVEAIRSPAGQAEATEVVAAVFPAPTPEPAEGASRPE